MVRWGLELKETNKCDLKSHTRPETRLYSLLSLSRHLRSLRLEWRVCCVSLGSSEPQSRFGFPHMPSHQDHLSCSLVISGACEKATQREDLWGKCGSATFNLILNFFLKKEENVC